eukprot:Colp12_sorted_trinity150504_noHs@34483
MDFMFHDTFGSVGGSSEGRTDESKEPNTNERKKKGSLFDNLLKTTNMLFDFDKLGQLEESTEELARRLTQEEEDAKIARQLQDEEDANYAQQVQSTRVPKPASIPQSKVIPGADNKFHNDVGSYIREYALLFDMRDLAKNCPSGIYVMPSKDESQCWNGVLFIHARDCPYQGGIFRFVLLIPDDYPHSRPNVKFQPGVYHPQIDETSGWLELSRAFPQWEARRHRLRHVLSYVKNCFYDISVENPANVEAAQLYSSERLLFNAKVKVCVKESIDNRHTNPAGSSIVLTPWNRELHAPCFQALVGRPDTMDGGS